MSDTGTPFVILWGTFAIAVFGVVQPYIVPYLRKRFRPRQVTVIEGMRPDIGYAGVGPVVGIAGIMYNKNDLTLVKRLCARVTRLDDNHEMALQGTLNRKRSIASNPSGFSDVIEGTLWMPFQMEADEDYPYDVSFVDMSIKSRIEAILSDMKSAWIKYMIEQLRIQVGRDLVLDDLTKLDAISPQLYQTWVERPEQKRQMEVLSETFPWRAGRFRLDLEIEVVGEKKQFSKQWHFTLTTEDENALRANIERIRALTCNRAPNIVGPFYSAWPEYEI